MNSNNEENKKTDNQKDILSIWKLLPLNIWLRILQLISTGLLVGGGEQLGKLLSDLIANNSKVAAIDFAMVFLLINLFIVNLCFYVMLLRLKANASIIKDQIINFISIFLTVIELFKLSIDHPSHSGNFILGLVIIVYFLILPMTSFGYFKKQIDKSIDQVLQDFIWVVSRNALYIISFVLIVAIPPAILFITANSTFISNILDINYPQGFWIINPAALSVGVLQIITIRSLNWNSGDLVLVNSKKKLIRNMLITSILINMLIGIFLIKETNLISQFLDNNCQNDCLNNSSIRNMFDNSLAIIAIKSLLSLVYFICFIFAYYQCRKILLLTFSQQGLLRSIYWFLCMGGGAGFLMAIERLIISNEFTLQNFHLVWLHALGFLCAYIGIFLGDLIIPRLLRGTQPISSS